MTTYSNKATTSSIQIPKDIKLCSYDIIFNLLRINTAGF